MRKLALLQSDHKDVKVSEMSFKPSNLATSCDGLLRSNWGRLTFTR